eukprot:CAMPEP_0184559970 /NCGR_PEP_ID=MMETSP0199_2-20130426/46696_1 /TAXON_ID=1112570 /ORGANISM="Thraustochytrium sp., Strain LLF1b" /LENGTH=756 /DNA_ID=CAMNT_0026957269 /DNA_START=138 /DNA_END=2408 /DNA_ORIENTATION=-
MTGSRARDMDDQVSQFVVRRCLAILSARDDLTAPDLLAPQECVTELAEAHERIKQSFHTGSVQSDDEFDHAEASFISGLLWLHLKRRRVPLMPYELFEAMQDLVTGLHPVDDDATAKGEAYINKVRQTLTAKHLAAIIRRLPQTNKTSLYLLFQLLHRLLQQCQTLTSLGICNVITPIVAKPANTAFLSIRHRKGIVFVRLALSSMLEHFRDLEAEFQSQSSPRQNKSESKSPSSLRSGVAPSALRIITKLPVSPSNLTSVSPSPPSFRRDQLDSSGGRLNSFGLKDNLESKSPSHNARTPTKRPVGSSFSPNRCSISMSGAKELHCETGSLQHSTNEMPQTSERLPLSVETSDGDAPASSGPHYELLTSLLQTAVHEACSGDQSWMDFATTSCRLPDHAMELCPASFAAPTPSPTSVAPAQDPSSNTEAKEGTTDQNVAASPEISLVRAMERMPSPSSQSLKKRSKSLYSAADIGERSETPEREPKSMIRSNSEGRLSQPHRSNQKHVRERLDRVLQVQLSSNQNEVAQSSVVASNNQDNENELTDDADTDGGLNDGSLTASGSSRLEHSGDDEAMGSGDSGADNQGLEGSSRSLLSSLEQQKKALKKKLKQFDEDFERKHGRRPGKLEKEPIRNLYEEYSSIRQRIAQCFESNVSRKRVAPCSPAGASTNVNALFHEKRSLQSKLREFERKFEEQNGRKIKYMGDIKGLESEYRRYKELKTRLGELKMANTASRSDDSTNFGMVSKRRGKVQRW